MCTEECGQLQPPDEHELVEAFAIVANDAFAFLGPERRLKPSPLATFDLDGERRRSQVSASDVR